MTAASGAGGAAVGGTGGGSGSGAVTGPAGGDVQAADAAVPTALWIAHVLVTDPDAYGRYAALAGPAIASHGGVFIARGGAHVQLEGPDRPRNVVARFPSVAAAVACYRSAEYQAALAHAAGAAVRELVIVEEARTA